MRSKFNYYLLTLIFLLLVTCFLTILVINNCISMETHLESDDKSILDQDQIDYPGLPDNPCDTKLTAAEQKLYDLIMSYRDSLGLPSIPFSASLSYVAQVHVRDLQANPPQGECNCHSWSSNGPWTPCCYTPDHVQASCMWEKPHELTDYPGYGYEISAYNSIPITPETALSVWKSSPGHNEVITSSGPWSELPWGAIGIGIYQNYSVVWFGEEPDPCSK